jgi:acetyl esterase/lipase
MKTIVLAHEGHVARNFQEVSNFATKSMGTYLDDFYGEAYFVSVALSMHPSGASWWTPTSPIVLPGPESVESLFASLGIGSFVLDLRNNSLVGKEVPVNLTGTPNVVMSRHYPGHMSVNHDDLSQLNPGLPVASETPPTFIVSAVDDPGDYVEYSLLYFVALKKAKVPVELHLFAQGGHAFALRRKDLPIMHWTDLAEAWLGSIGVVPKR